MGSALPKHLDSAEYAIAFHAVATVGGVSTTANPLLSADELAAQLRDCGEEIFVYGEADGATPLIRLTAVLELEAQL